MSSSQEEGLCCCEYARASDGATRHLLQCLCECDAFDQLADEMLDSCCSTLCCGCCDEPSPPGARAQAPRDADARRELLKRVFETAADRARMPWFGGARRINAGAAAAPLLLYTLRSLARLTHMCMWPLFWLGLAATALIWLHVMSLRIRMRTDFFASWIVFSVVGIYSDFSEHVQPNVSGACSMFMHLLLIMASISFALALLRRPLPCRYGADSVHASAGAQVNASCFTHARFACKVCGCPIRGRDHHCVWINQCVGAHNHKPFLLFVSSFAALATSYAWLAYRSLPPDTRLVLPSWEAGASVHCVLPMQAACALYALGGGCFAVALLVGQVHNISHGLTTHERQRRLHARAVPSTQGGAVGGHADDSNAENSGTLLHARVETVASHMVVANWYDWWHAGGNGWQWRWAEAAHVDEPHNL